jgi:dTDP-4-dehydrorhamnose 3,5-epimerase
MRTYDARIFHEHGLQTEWLQENESRSNRKHIIRGLHFQKPPHAETKLVRAMHGTVLDVFVDLRKNSPTYGQWDAIELSAGDQRMVYIPKGFAHGFCTLTDEAVLLYKVDHCHALGFEGGLRWDDLTLSITWPTSAPFLSARDRQLETFANFESPFAGD